jgi:peptidoglycan/xylan/chitin deacetylase (PgdA/CDA1 family)
MKDAFAPIVLMYHSISSGPLTMPPERETGAELYSVSLENFKAQMSWLKDKGFTPVIFETFRSADQTKPVIITFDDGEMNSFQQAYPVLKEFGWKAYFFIIVKRIGKDGYMGFKEIKELHQAGMVIGSHGLSHEILTDLLDSQMEEELRASKKNLEINLGAPIDTISIPRGFCNEKILQTAYKLGYKTIFVSDKPAKINPGCFGRIAIKSNWSLERFDLGLKGKTPLIEKGTDAVKKTLKTLLREKGYNWVRSILIKLIQ